MDSFRCASMGTSLWELRYAKSMCVYSIYNAFTPKSDHFIFQFANEQGANN